MPVAFELAEQYQISVIVLTDRQIAEALYTQHPYDLEKTDIDRGRLVVDPEKLKFLKTSDRFDPDANGGISSRWLPGSEAATYCAQGDEHNSMGAVNESSLNAKLQMEKRLRKLQTLKARLPAPQLSVAGRSATMADWTKVGDQIELLAIGWGSTGDVFHDVMCSDELRARKIAYLHYTYLWPLRTEELRKVAMRAKRIVLVEQNYQGQLGMLIRMDCGMDIPDKILKYDGRPFFYDELLSSVLERCGDASGGKESRSALDCAGTRS
ncbi:pyruvate/2-oxoacid:ferredoxin oxidoreductase alpha subunit [Bradyrhizobium sp. F1.13.4]